MQKRPSIWGALLTLIVIASVLVWWFTSLTNDDPLWFLRSFNHQADWITIYWDGETIMLFPEDPEYVQVMTAFADAIAHWTGYENGVGLSDETLERYRDEGRLLELHYNDPVQVHTRHLYAAARHFYVPLSGTHAEYRRIFAGLIDAPRIGVLNAGQERFQNLQQAVNATIP